MKNGIGGYFSLELPENKSFHPNAIALNTARNSLEYILRSKNYRKIYIPYYTCDVLLEPLDKLGVEFEFYSVDYSLYPLKIYDLRKDEVFLYTNYWGLKSIFVKKLAEIYKDHLIVDNSQSFYSNPISGIDTFYSPRKFFGVPDGAYLYTDKFIEVELERDISVNRMSHLLKRIDLGAQSGYLDFKKSDNDLSNQPILKMSILTERILTSIDYQKIADVRIRNFKYLDSKLKGCNDCEFILEEGEVPMVYPFLSSKGKYLRQLLIADNIFIPTYWPNVLRWVSFESCEYFFTENMLALPIDQRLSFSDLDCIVEHILLNL